MASNLFRNLDVKNNPHRNAFSKDTRRLLSAKCGELLPVYYTMLSPGDVLSLDSGWFTRTIPVESPAYTRIRESIDYFFVPWNLIWRQSPQFFQQLNQNPTTAVGPVDSSLVGETFPNISLSELSACFETPVQSADNLPFGETENMFGFKNGDLSAKLLRYLGYGAIFSPSSTQYGTEYTETYDQSYKQDLIVQVGPLAAYQKIYNDYFRNTHWESAMPFTYNMDYWTGEGTFGNSLIEQVQRATENINMLSMRYASFAKDMFTGELPDSQMGDPASIYISAASTQPNTPVTITGGTVVAQLHQKFYNDTFWPVGSISTQSGNWAPATLARDDTDTRRYDVFMNSDLFSGDSLVVNPNDTIPAQTNSLVESSNFRWANALLSAGTDLDASFTVLQYRQAEALQKWKEIAISGSQTFRDQVKRHFGVTVPYAYSDMVDYLGSDESYVQITEVTNTNLAEGNDADIRGKGVGAGRGSGVHYKAETYGIFMAIYHAAPQLDYDTPSVNPELMAVGYEDFPIPEFDSLGYQEVPLPWLTNGRAVNFPSPYLGWSVRNLAWKSDVDRVFGAFSTRYKSWRTAITDEYISQYFSRGQNDIAQFMASFIKVNPSYLNPIFNTASNGTWDTDHLLINLDLIIKVVRSLSRTGLPY